jgi:hypothetical protein
MKPKNLLLMATALAVSTALVAAAAKSGSAGRRAAQQETPAPQDDQPRAASPDGRRAAYIQPGGLMPPLRGALRVMGDRLQRPGKERLTLAGTLTLDGEATEFALVSEFPGKLRLVLAGGGRGRHVLVFDERDGDRGAAEGRDADLLETLAFDTAEHFFEGQSRGLGTRLLGTRFRDDGGPGGGESFYDIYQVGESVGVGRAPRLRSKLYLVNSDTQLLERVRYEDGGGAEATRVEVAFEWQQIDGQRVPRRVTRTVDGKTILTLDVRTASVGPRADDGVFAAARPQ